MQDDTIAHKKAVEESRRSIPHGSTNFYWPTQSSLGSNFIQISAAAFCEKVPMFIQAVLHLSPKISNFIQIRI